MHHDPASPAGGVPTTELDSLRSLLEERAAEGSLELPLLPDVAAQVLGLVQDPECDARSLAELLHRDQALAAHVLHVANSPLYGARESIVSLHQAVARLGLSLVSNIAVTIAVQGRVFAVPGHEQLVRDLWRHSIAAAAWAREIARLRRRNMEGAYLCGLLHDIGRPISIQGLIDLAGEQGVSLEGVDLRAEAAAVHARIGELLVDSWDLAPWMAAAVRCHHVPAQAGEHAELAHTAALADALAHWSADEAHGEEDAPHEHPSLEALDLYREELEDLLDLRARIQETVEAFR